MDTQRGGDGFRSVTIVLTFLLSSMTTNLNLTYLKGKNHVFHTFISYLYFESNNDRLVKKSFIKATLAALQNSWQFGTFCRSCASSK